MDAIYSSQYPAMALVAIFLGWAMMREMKAVRRMAFIGEGDIKIEGKV